MEGIPWACQRNALDERTLCIFERFFSHHFLGHQLKENVFHIYFENSFEVIWLILSHVSNRETLFLNYMGFWGKSATIQVLCSPRNGILSCGKSWTRQRHQCFGVVVQIWDYFNEISESLSWQKCFEINCLETKGTKLLFLISWNLRPDQFPVIFCPVINSGLCFSLVNITFLVILLVYKKIHFQWSIL